MIACHPDWVGFVNGLPRVVEKAAQGLGLLGGGFGDEQRLGPGGFVPKNVPPPQETLRKPNEKWWRRRELNPRP
jgi:hypothetical protein